MWHTLGDMSFSIVSFSILLLYNLYEKELSTRNNTVGFYNSEKFNRNRFFKAVINKTEGENCSINNKSNLEYTNRNYKDSDKEENTFCSEINDNKKSNKNNYIYMPNHNKLRIGDFLKNFLFLRVWVWLYQLWNYSQRRKFGKTYKKFYQYEKENTNTVDSIVEKGKDIGIKCFKNYKIVELFQYTYFKIKKEKENNILSILKFLGFPDNNYYWIN